MSDPTTSDPTTSDPTTLEDLLAPLDQEGPPPAPDPRAPRPRNVTPMDVGANLATYFDTLVEPALDALASDLAWRRRAALAVALGLVERTPGRAAALARLLADRHTEVSHHALTAYREPPPPEALEPLRALAAQGCAHADHIEGLAAGRDPGDVAHVRAAARSRNAALQNAGLVGLATMGATDVDSVGVLVEALCRSRSRPDAAESLIELVEIEGVSSLAISSEHRALLTKLLPRLPDYQRPSLAELAGAPLPPATGGPRPHAGAAPPGLSAFGTILDGTSADHPVFIGDAKIVGEVARLLTSTPRRCVVLVGPSGSGKSAVVHEVARRLAVEGTVVLASSTGEIMAGTKFLGEWETRLKQLIGLCQAPARVILYLSDVHALRTQGRSIDRDGSFADMLAPALERGELAILGEAGEALVAQGIDRHGVLRSAFERVRVAPASGEQTAAVVRGRLGHHATRDGVAYGASPAVVDLIVEMASSRASGAAAPGAAARLLDRMVEDQREAILQAGSAHAEVALESGHVVAALARSTGLPTALLDDRAPFDRAAVRAYFEERILGQPEAVDVVVELITLIKAGVTDPDRPFGSLFFVGPTGVGKTEVAKALATFLYGSSDRLIRVDMSELKHWDSHERLIGSSGKNEEITLTREVAERPFSVVLLDEIEKAHSNVHDLLLQLLDDGRLTDANGKTTDFRRTVVVMTSNVGSGIDVDSVGFGGAAEHAPSEEKVLREIRKVFRPELINRFGRVVVFRPLSGDTMRTLVRRELGNVVVRSGVLRRRLAVDLAPELVDLLTREGFSIAYGARPLKRRVEQRVLLPIAEMIVSLGPDAAGTILRAEADGERVVVRAIAPAAEPASSAEGAEPSAEPTLAAVRRKLQDLAARSAALAAHPRRAQAVGRRADLMAQAAGRTFWDEARSARAAMTELSELDDREHARETLERRIEGASELLRDRGAASLRRAQRVFGELEGALSMLEHRYLVEEPGDRLDVIVTLTRIGAGLEASEFLMSLVEMYEAWASAHDVRASRLDETGDEQGALSVTLHLDGHGLFGLLRDEAGLHRPSETGRGGERKRFAVRVTSLACPEAAPSDIAIKKSTRRKRARLLATHAPSGSSLDVSLAPEQVRALGPELDRLVACWLGARLAGDAPASDALVRRYGIDDKYALDESTGLRVRVKELPRTGLDAIFEARVRARIEN